MKNLILKIASIGVFTFVSVVTVNAQMQKAPATPQQQKQIKYSDGDIEQFVKTYKKVQAKIVEFQNKIQSASPEQKQVIQSGINEKLETLIKKDMSLAKYTAMAARAQNDPGFNQRLVPHLK